MNNERESVSSGSVIVDMDDRPAHLDDVESAQAGSDRIRGARSRTFRTCSVIQRRPRTVVQVEGWLFYGMIGMSILLSFIMFAELAKIVSSPGGSTRIQIPTSAAEDTWTMSDMFSSTYSKQLYPISGTTWINGTSLIYSNRTSGLLSRVMLSGETHEQSFNLAALALESWTSASPDGQYLTGYNASTSLFRHSFVSDCYLVSTVDEQVQLVASKVRLCEVYDEFVVVVSYKGNVLLYDRADLAAGGHAITSDGAFVGDAEPSNPRFASLVVGNGVPDWVYEEEVLGSADGALRVSPSQSYIAFLKFDDTAVNTYEYPYYDIDDMYQFPQIIELKYPRAGTPNPSVTVHAVDVASSNVIDVPLDAQLYEYIYQIEFIDDTTLLVRTMNRLQNEESMYSCTFAACESVHSQTSTTWISDFPVMISPDRSTATHIEMQADGRLGVVVIDIATKTSTAAPKPAECLDATALIGFDTSGMWIQCTPSSGRPSERIVVWTKLQDGDAPVGPAYLTTSDGVRSNTPGYWFGASSFGQGELMHILLSVDGPSYPASYLCTTGATRETVMFSNADEFEESVREKNLPRVEYVSIPAEDILPAGSPVLQHISEYDAVMQYPPNFSKHKKYPVLIYVYGAPHYQAVTKEYALGFSAHMASLGVIVCSLNGRGSFGYGEYFEKQTVYEHLGTAEAEDQMAFAKYLKTLRYVDEDRIAVWGWSYGGYLTSRIMTFVEDPADQPFAVGAAVAPVTDWRLYDSVYAERYMGIPVDNTDGYNGSSVLLKTQNLKSPMFILHGSADDNVHFQNSVLFINSLIGLDNVHFDFAMYPDRQHSIAKDNARPQLYQKLVNFFSAEL